MSPNGQVGETLGTILGTNIFEKGNTAPVVGLMVIFGGVCTVSSSLNGGD